MKAKMKEGKNVEESGGKEEVGEQTDEGSTGRSERRIWEVEGKRKEREREKE